MTMEQIYKEHSMTVYKYLLSLTHDEHLAEELTQETFYQAVKSINKFDKSCKITTWLCAIVKNQLLSYNRKHPSIEELETTNIATGSVEGQVISDMGKVDILKRIHTLEEHLKECSECKGVENMMKKDVVIKENVTMEKEIDFLKKLRDKTNKKLRLTVGICAIIIIAILAGLYYKFNYIGTLDYVENAGILNMKVDGKKLYLEGDNVAVTRVLTEEKDGVVTIEVYTGPFAIIVSDGYVIDKTFDNDIKKVVLAGANNKSLTIYKDGKQIEKYIADLYNKKIKTATDSNEALLTEAAVYFAADKSDDINVVNKELYAKGEAYGFKYRNVYEDPDELIAQYGDEESTLEYLQKAMIEYSCYMMACVEDLEEIEWNVEFYKEKETYVYSLEELSKLAGKDLKEFGKSDIALQELKNTMPKILNEAE